MVTEGFEQYYKMGKNFPNPLSDVSKTVWELCRRVNQGALEMTGENLQRTAEQLKRFSAIKRPEELLQLQKECFQENMNAWMSNAQKLANLSTSSFEEMNRTFSSNMKDQQQNTMNSGSSKGSESGSKNSEKTK